MARADIVAEAWNKKPDSVVSFAHERMGLAVVAGAAVQDISTPDKQGRNEWRPQRMSAIGCGLG
jgi:hypothetical protein